MKMLCYDRIDFSKGIDVDKTNVSKECNVGISEIVVLSFNRMYAVDFMIY